MKKTMNEFKEFIAKGNVFSMAVGVVMGGAFTAIVNAIVEQLITPLIGLIMGASTSATLLSRSEKLRLAMAHSFKRSLIS